MTLGGDEFHTRSVAWLENGARDDPPRDVAVHANSCPICAMQAAALDGLAIIDPGRAPRPPSRLGPLTLAPSLTWNRAAIVIGAILLTVGIGRWALASSAAGVRAERPRRERHAGSDGIRDCVFHRHPNGLPLGERVRLVDGPRYLTPRAGARILRS